MNHTEQKIKELEELAIEFNNKLKDLREEAKREEFKAGDYCAWSQEAFDRNLFGVKDPAKAVFKVISSSPHPQLNNRVIYKTSIGDYYESYLRKATNEEIEKHLIEEAEKKGFKIGVEVFYKLRDSGVSKGKITEFKYSYLGNGTCTAGKLQAKYGSFCITDVDNLEIGTPLSIQGHTVDFFPNHIQVGCTRVELETIKQIANHYKL
jgi:hypothetical protein